MQLTRFTDYALRVLMYVANRQGERTTIREVSEAHQISEEHLMKVVTRLSNLGYLATFRGKGGGIVAGRPSAEISLGSVIRAIEPLASVECFEPDYDSRCMLFPQCALRDALGKAQLRFLESLDNTTLADVMPKVPAVRSRRR